MLWDSIVIITKYLGMPNNLFVTFEKEINRCYLNNIRCKEMYPTKIIN